MSKKNYIIIAAVLVVLGLIIFWGAKQPQQANAPVVSPETFEPSDEVIYYYGEECPHCQDVAEFLEENKVGEKVDFSKKEVWHDKGNAAEMQARGAECGLDKDKLGVPFLYARGQCYIGTPDVEGFFRKEAGL